MNEKATNEFKAALKMQTDKLRARSDAEILFEHVMVGALATMLADHFTKEDSDSVQGVIDSLKRMEKDVLRLNHFINDKSGEIAWDAIYNLEHILRVYEIAWVNPKNSESMVQGHIVSNIDDYLPGATVIKEEYNIKGKRCDILVEHDGERILIEVKKGIVNQAAVNQLRWYMDNSGIKEGILIGSRITDNKILHEDMGFIQYKDFGRG